MADKTPKISDVIKKLQELQKEHCDLPMAVSEEHEYWGSVETFIQDHNIVVKQCQPDGPKKPGRKEID